MEEDDIKKILKIEIDKFKERLLKKHLFIELSDEAEAYFVKNGYDPSYGARPMRRLLQTKIEDALSLKIISGEFSEGGTACIGVCSDEIVITVKPADVEHSSESTETGRIEVAQHIET